MTLRIGLTGFRAGADRLRVEVNGVPLKAGAVDSQVVCEDLPVRGGQPAAHPA